VSGVLDTVEHTVAPVLDNVLTPITSLLDQSPAGGALAPVTNILHGLLG